MSALYCIRADAPYTPATWQGSWTTLPAFAEATAPLDPVKWAPDGPVAFPMTATGPGPLTGAIGRGAVDTTGTWHATCRTYAVGS